MQKPPVIAPARAPRRQQAGAGPEQESEAAALARLNEASVRLWQTQDLHHGLQEILSATIALMSADFGNIQLLDPAKDVLHIAVHRGFKHGFLDFFREVSTEDNAACGWALRSGQRIVIEDVEKDAPYAPYRKIARAAGYRGVQSTPLIAYNGRRLGMISTHFRKPHRPSETELRRLDLYVRQAAEFIERCNREQMLKDREEKLRLALEAAAAGIWTWNAKSNETDWDDRFHALYGLSHKHARTFDTWISQVHKEDRQRVLGELEKLRTQPGNDKWDVEFRIVRPDGTLVWIHALGDAMRDARGRLLRLRGINTDITKRRLTEEALRESEQHFRALVTASSNVVYRMSADWAEMRHLVGRSFIADTEGPSRTWMDKYILPQDQERVRSAIRKAVRTKTMFELEHRVRQVNGSTGWMFSRAIPILDASGRVLEWFGCASDITSRKTVEDHLRLSEQRFAKAFAASPDAIIISRKADGQILEVNPAWERIFGYSRRQSTGRSSAELRLFADPADRDRAIAQVFKHGAVNNFELRIRRRTGELRDVTLSIEQVRLNSEECLLTIVRDITEQKQSALALRESEIRYRQLVHSLPVAVYTCDARGHITLYNAAAIKLWGHEPRPGQRWCAAVRTFTPEGTLLRKSQLPIANAVREAEPLRGMERIVERADGTRSHVLGFPDPVLDMAGHVIGGVNVLVDITELKVAEEALQTSMNQVRTLSQAVEQSPASVVITTRDGSISYVNPKFSQVTGYSLQEVLGKNPRLLRSGHQPREFYKQMWDTINAGNEWRGEFCNRRKNGELFWEYAVIAPVKDRGGHVRHFVAIKEDVTAQRLALQALREREERLRAILNTVVDAVVTIDRTGSILAVNPAAERMFGYTSMEMEGHNVSMLMPPPFREEHDSYLERYHRTGEARIIGMGREAQGQRKDGSVFPVELSVSEVDGMDMYTGVIRDITQRRRLEKEVLDVSEAERAAIGQDLHDDLGQQLAGVWCMSRALTETLEKRAAPEAADARDINAILGKVLALTRSLARGLHPVAVETGGLAAAFTALAGRITQMFGVPCEFHGREVENGLDQATAAHLFRIGQEAVTNAAKHARAASVKIDLSRRNGLLTLAVRDDGCGLSAPPGPQEGGMGLRIMRYRADLIGAQFKIKSRPGSGTTMTCTVKLSKPDSHPPS